ncbi:unnamed protein product [Closterium sp. NIES-54]
MLRLDARARKAPRGPPRCLPVTFLIASLSPLLPVASPSPFRDTSPSPFPVASPSPHSYPIASCPLIPSPPVPFPLASQPPFPVASRRLLSSPRRQPVPSPSPHALIPSPPPSLPTVFPSPPRPVPAVPPCNRRPTVYLPPPPCTRFYISKDSRSTPGNGDLRVQGGGPSSGSASSGRDVGSCGYRALTGLGAGTTCWSPDHSASCCYHRLGVLDRERFGPHAITPHLPSRLRQCTTAPVESHLPSLGPFLAARVETCNSSLGACAVPSPGAAEGLCVGAAATTSLVSAFGARSGATSQTAQLSFTVDTGASGCFFRDCTDLTPLCTPVTVALADPSMGPVVSRSTTTLPCPTTPSGFLTGYYTPSFSRNLVSLPVSFALLPRSPAPSCTPCVEECYFLIVVNNYSRYTTVFPLRWKADVPTVLEPWLLARGGAQTLCGFRLHSDRGVAEGEGAGDARAGGVGSGGAGGVGVEVTPVEDTAASTRRPRPTSPSSFPSVPQFPPRSSLRPVAAEPGGVPAGGTGGPRGAGSGGAGSGGAGSGGTCTVAPTSCTVLFLTQAAAPGAVSVATAGESRGGATAAAGESRGGIPTAAAGAVATAAGESRGVTATPREGRAGVPPAAAGAVLDTAGDSRVGVAAAVGEGSAGVLVATAGAAAAAAGEGRGGATGAAARAGTVATDARGGGAAATTRRSPLSRAVSPEPRRSHYRADGPFHLVLLSHVPPPLVLPQPPESSLTVLHDPLSDYLRASRPVVSRVFSALVTRPTAPLLSISALVTPVAGFSPSHCLDYAAHLVSGPARSPSSGGAPVLPLEVLEDRQFELGFLAATITHLCAMQLAPEGNPHALDIRIPRTHSEAVSGPWALYCIEVEGAEMTSYRSTGTSVDAVPPPGSTSNLWVLQHIAAQCDYELHSLESSTAFLQGSLHEQIWLRRPPGFTGSFPPGTQWQVRRPVYGVHQAPREWHDTLRSTLAALDFFTSSLDPSLFVHRGSTPFFVLVYVDDLVFATPDQRMLASVKEELQRRHTCTDLDELQHYLGLQITRERAARTITLMQSHMVEQILMRFRFPFSNIQLTPLAVDHGLTAPLSDESFESSGPYMSLRAVFPARIAPQGELLFRPESSCFPVRPAALQPVRLPAYELCPPPCPAACTPPCPAARALLCPAARTPCSPRAALPCSPRAALPYSPRTALPCSPHVPCQATHEPCSPRAALPCSQRSCWAAMATLYTSASQLELETDESQVDLDETAPIPWLKQ